MTVNQPERVVVQRAHHLRAVDEAIGERNTAMRADCLKRMQPATAQPEYGHLLIADDERTTLTEGNLINRAKPA